MLKVGSLAILLTMLFQSAVVQAQYGGSYGGGAYPAYPAHVQYCYLDRNPHSYACQAWVFQGSHMFPLNVIDWRGAIEGEWKTITYANPWSDNDGPEFRMLVNAQNPRIPVGVLNKNNNTMMGSLTFEGNKAVWTNWRGKKLKTRIGEYAVTDSFTFKFSFPDGDGYEQSFVCRDFNRNNVHHLTCSWYLIRFTDYYRTAYTWEHRGYFGFLKDGDMGVVNPPAYPQPVPVQPPALPPPAPAPQ